ncbi:MAG: hypothetical protein GF335_00180 [Candidatus Moranbacteria bacterium]|nr:hypothetical protein [Candidatus Moranbacteria bacterium]
MRKELLLIVISMSVIGLAGCNKSKKQDKGQIKDSINKTSEEKKKNQTNKSGNVDKNIITLDDGRSISIDIPKSWKIKIDEEMSSLEDPAKTFKIQKKDNDNFEILITPLNSNNKKLNTKDMLEKEWLILKEIASEKEMIIKEIKGDQFTGHYFMPLTDNSSANIGDDYKYLSRSIIFYDDIVLSSTYTSREKNDPSFDEWIKIQKTLKVEQKTPKKNSILNNNSIKSPNGNWRVYIESNSYKKHYDEYKTNYSYLMGNDGELNISIKITEMSDKVSSTQDCQEDLWDKLKNYDESKKYQQGDYAIIEYIQKTVEGNEVEGQNLSAFVGETINQKHLYATYYKNGHCIDIHLSKLFFEKKDQKLFDNYLNKIIIASSPPQN